VSLTNVWVQTLGDGLVRADQIVGIDAHQTPAITGKPSRWLLDVVASVPTGSGSREGWTITVLHRTVIQTDHNPGSAPVELARLLAQLDATDATGVISAERSRPDEDRGADWRPVRFRFTPFAQPAPGQLPDAEFV
jgi:hypothetical protein